MTHSRRLLLGLALAAAIFAADQYSKLLILNQFILASHPPFTLTPFFDLALVWNRGISFGMLAGQNQPVILTVMSSVIILILLYWMWRTPSFFIVGALGAVIGGAAGNASDRLRFGAVVDFLDFHLSMHHWPAFNIADSAIFIGVVLLCIHSMFMEPKNT